MKKLTDNERYVLQQILGSVFHCMGKDGDEYQEYSEDFILTLSPKEMKSALNAAEKIGLDTKKYEL